MTAPIYIDQAIVDTAKLFSKSQIAMIAKAEDRVEQRTGCRMQVVTTSAALSPTTIANTKNEAVDARVVFDVVKKTFAYNGSFFHCRETNWALSDEQSGRLAAANSEGQRLLTRELKIAPNDPAGTIARSLPAIFSKNLKAFSLIQAENAATTVRFQKEQDKLSSVQSDSYTKFLFITGTVIAVLLLLLLTSRRLKGTF